MADKLSSPGPSSLVNADLRIAKTGRLLSAEELRKKYGWKPVATDERMENLRSNLEFFV